MRSWRRAGPRVIAGLAVLGSMALCGSAGAATLTTVADRSSYGVGDTIALSVVLDYEGAPSYSVEGRIVFDPALVAGLDVTTSLDGLGIPPFPDCGTGYCDVFQYQSLTTPVPDLVTATVTLSADAPGLVTIEWDPPPTGVFGAPSLSFAIVPEPALALLLGAAAGATTLRGRGRW